MVLVRRIGSVIIALAAIGVLLFMAPDGVDSDTHQERVAKITDRNEANNEMTEGAPQQEVVNGWTSIDYLELMSDQLNGTPDRRPAALLTLLVLAVCLHLATNTTTGVVLQRAVPRSTGPGTPTTTTPVTPGHTNSAPATPAARTTP